MTFRRKHKTPIPQLFVPYSLSPPPHTHTFIVCRPKFLQHFHPYFLWFRYYKQALILTASFRGGVHLLPSTGIPSRAVFWAKVEYIVKFEASLGYIMHKNKISFKTGLLLLLRILKSLLPLSTAIGFSTIKWPKT